MAMENVTPRHGMPQLAVAQAAKEITHNEALALIDALLHPVVEAIASVPPTLTAVDAGKCWLVGANATGAFAGNIDRIAYWTGGSWRFATPTPGMRLWHRPSAALIYFVDQQWLMLQPVDAPTSGSVVDVEARATLTALIARLTSCGFLPDS
jgi:hypothetical protein